MCVCVLCVFVFVCVCVCALKSQKSVVKSAQFGHECSIKASTLESDVSTVFASIFTLQSK